MAWNDIFRAAHLPPQDRPLADKAANLIGHFTNGDDATKRSICKMLGNVAELTALKKAGHDDFVKVIESFSASEAADAGKEFERMARINSSDIDGKLAMKSDAYALFAVILYARTGMYTIGSTESECAEMSAALLAVAYKLGRD